MKLNLPVFTVMQIFTAAFACPVSGICAEPVVRVAFYEDVPDISRFSDALQEEWNLQKRDGKIQVVRWVCDSGEMPENADVIVFDAMVMKTLLEKKQLRELPDSMMNEKEYLPFCLPVAKSSGKLYCLPQMFCTYMLFLRPEDKELLAQKDFESVLDKIGPRKTDGVKPEGTSEGMLCCAFNDFFIGSVYEFLYRHYGEKTDGIMDKLVRTCGVKQLKYHTPDYELFVQARWFSEGIGRAYMDYGECLAKMGNYRNKAVIRPLIPQKTPCFGDYVAVTVHCPDQVVPLAHEVVRILASPRYMEKAIKGKSGEKQYLMPLNRRLFHKLAETDPVYKQLLSITEKEDNYIMTDTGGLFQRTHENGKRLFQKYQ